MAAGEGLKGTVTPVGSLVSPDEALKAARRVEEAIADRRKELDRLHAFVADNSATITLVRQLPDELSHQIMVPFGKAAFIPGRLVHTNELLVLLGEAYYVERTAKQTAEILQRRGETLEDQVETLGAVIGDLETEAKFFDSTAAEVAEGIVDIREEYIEEPRKSGPGIDGSYKGSMGQSCTKQMVPLPAETSAYVSELEDSSDNVVSQPSAMGFDGRRAFTASIVEHSLSISLDQSTKSSTLDQPLGSNRAKPVSRFKMQRGNR